MSTITTADADRVREYLTAGRTVQQVADVTGLPRSAVLAVIKNTRGWLHDTDRDVAIQPALPDAPDAAKATVDELLGLAAGIDDKAVARELRKAVDQIARLREVVTTAAQRVEAAREIAVLERRLAEAKASLKGTRRTSAPAAVGASDAEIRAWAKREGVECRPVGRLPAAIREQYDAAHRAEN